MRIRTIKPEFFLHEKLFQAEKESGLPLRLAFAGLWCAADRSGRFKWEPMRLGVQILPYDQIDFSRVLDALSTRGFLVKYASPEPESAGVYGFIPGFPRHQVINNKERVSELPDPCKCELPTREARVNDACPSVLFLDQGEGKGREGNKEGNRVPPKAPQKKTAPRIPATPEALALAELYSRRPTTPWSEKEVRAFKSIQPIDSEELALVIDYTRWSMETGGCFRRELGTLLNNWRGEVDRARLWRAGKMNGLANGHATPQEAREGREQRAHNEMLDLLANVPHMKPESKMTDEELRLKFTDT